MTLVLILAAGIWGLGMALKTPIQARLYMLALLYVAVLFVMFALPDGHPLRESLGGGPGQWLVFGGLVAAILVYRQGLLRVRSRAVAAEEARGAPDPREGRGPFSGVELQRYARHIALREVGGPGPEAPQGRTRPDRGRRRARLARASLSRRRGRRHDRP